MINVNDLFLKIIFKIKNFLIINIFSKSRTRIFDLIIHMLLENLVLERMYTLLL